MEYVKDKPKSTFRRVRKIKDELIEQGVDDFYIDGLLGTVRDRTGTRQTDISGRIQYEEQRLHRFINLCEKKDSDIQELQRAAMEIPYLAPPGDIHSITALANLLEHDNKRVQESTCIGLGIIAGEEAKEVLRGFERQCDSMEMKKIAKKSLRRCEFSELAQILESENVRQLKDEIVFIHKACSPQLTSQVIYICSATGILGFISSLMAWYQYDIPIIHPVFSVFGLTFCVGLAAAAVWRFKCSS